MRAWVLLPDPSMPSKLMKVPLPGILRGWSLGAGSFGQEPLCKALAALVSACTKPACPTAVSVTSGMRRSGRSGTDHQFADLGPCRNRRASAGRYRRLRLSPRLAQGPAPASTHLAAGNKADVSLDRPARHRPRPRGCPALTTVFSDELAKGPVHHTVGFFARVRVSDVRPGDHKNHPPVALLGRPDKAIACLGRVAGFQPIRPATQFQQRVAVVAVGRGAVVKVELGLPQRSGNIREIPQSGGRAGCQDRASTCAAPDQASPRHWQSCELVIPKAFGAFGHLLRQKHLRCQPALRPPQRRHHCPN